MARVSPYIQMVIQTVDAYPCKIYNTKRLPAGSIEKFRQFTQNFHREHVLTVTTQLAAGSRRSPALLRASF